MPFEVGVPVDRPLPTALRVELLAKLRACILPPPGAKSQSITAVSQAPDLMFINVHPRCSDLHLISDLRI